MKNKLCTYGIWTAVIVFSVSMFCAFLLSGCVSEPGELIDRQKVEEETAHALEQSRPELNDSEALAAAKEELAQSRQKWTEEKEILTAKLSSIRGRSNTEILRLQEELAQQKRLNEQHLEQLQQKFQSELFPYRYFYLGALGLVVLMALMAYLRKNIPLALIGVALAFVLLGIAQIQKMYPQVFVYCTIGCIVPVAIYFIAYGISWLRKEKAIKILAQAIESEQGDPKAVIKESDGIKNFIEKQIRKYVPDKTKKEYA